MNREMETTSELIALSNSKVWLMNELHIFIGKGCKKKNSLLVWKFDKKIKILTFLYRNGIIGL